jgi:hypothetical protein
MKTFNPAFNRSYLESHEFNVKSQEIAGTWCYLITPHPYKSNWTKEDLIFRSSIWDEHGLPVSLSYKKFFNWNENFQLVPPPTSIVNLAVMEKLDGSTLIVSRYKGEYIFRTRGSFYLDHLPNSDEIDDLFIQHRVLGLENAATWMNSYIFEWYSPAHKIVIDYGDKPLIWLTGVISHEDYSYMTQEALDIKAEWYSLKRPKVYSISSIEDLLNLGPISMSPTLNEGFCVYFNGDQDILKVKSAKYLALHAFKSELNIGKIVDLFIVYNKPSKDDFIKLVTSQFDYECAAYASDMIEYVCEAGIKVNTEIIQITKFVNDLKGETRKWAAEAIIGLYGNSIRSGMAFNLLSGKAIEDKQFKRLLEQYLEG